MSDFLGGSGESVIFAEVGDSCDGTLLSIDEREDAAPDGTVHRWPDGNAKKVYLWELETAEGQKTLWVRSNLVTVLRDACRAAGARSQADLIGARVQVKHHALGEAQTKGFNKPKLYQAKVTLADKKAEDYDPFAE